MKRVSKIISLVLGVALTGAMLSGCGGAQSGSSASASSASASSSASQTSSGGTLKKVSIQIDGAAVPYYAPLYLAKEKGYFAEQGLDVEFYYAAAADIVKNVAAGNVEFGFPNADNVVLAKSQGIPVKVVHTTYQHGLGSTIFKKNSGIKTPKDLKGKTIAVTSLGSANYVQLQVLLKKAGLSTKDVKVDVIGTGAILNSLTTGKVDAITFSMLRTIELNNSGENVSEFRSDDYLPSFGNVLIAGDKLIQSNPQEVQGFCKALTKSIEYIKNGHVDEAVSLSLQKYAPTYASKKAITEKIINQVFIPYLWTSDYTKQHGIGASDLSKWNNLIKTEKEYGLIDSTFDAKDLIWQQQ